MDSVLQDLHSVVTLFPEWFQGSILLVFLSYVVFHVIDTATFALISRALRPKQKASQNSETSAEAVEKLTSARRAGLYLNSALHALLVGITAASLIAKYGVLGPEAGAALAIDNVSMPGPGLTDLGTVRVIASISVGYFAYDFVATAPDWAAHPEDFFHHLLGLALASSFFLSNRTTRMGAHLFITELSTPFVNIMWALRKTGHGSSKLYQVVSLLFVAVFFATRQVYLPYVAYVAWVHLYDEFVVHVPHIALALLALVGLNTFWMYKIVRMMLRGGPNDKKKGGDEAVKDE